LYISIIVRNLISISFLILNEIEIKLRTIIEMYNYQNFSKTCFDIFSDSQSNRIPESVSDMTFYQYIYFINKNWDKYKHIIEDKEIFNKILNKANKIRNKVCHYNPINNNEKETLGSTLNWLRSKI
jgi:hypothetical protein